MGYYRVQSGSRNPLDLLISEEQVSRAWHRDDKDRAGVSVCDSLESLAAYLAGPGSGIPFGCEGWVLVELEGNHSNDIPLDHEHGEYLIHPTRVVSVQVIPDSFFDMISDAYDAQERETGT